MLRAFETLTGAEARTWWVRGECVVTSAHPDTPQRCPSVPATMLEQVRLALERLDLPFVAVDLAQHADGRWRVIEVGDGQVSDRPASLRPQALVEAVLGTPTAET